MIREEQFKKVPPRDDEFIENLLLRKFIRIHENLGQVELIDVMMQAIQETQDEPVKVVSLIGGAASGKSTLAGNLVEAFTRRGILADCISTDDFVIGDRAYRREHFEVKEPRAKYDFALMNRMVSEIRANTDKGKATAVPTYNPITGIAIAEGAENYKHYIGKVKVLIVEGDFDEVTQPSITFYLHMDDENRLQNRLGRDVKERNEASAALIRKNFEQRQVTQHVQYTLPTIQRAEYVINVEPIINGWQYDVYRILSRM